MANTIKIPTIIITNLIDQDKSSSAHYIKLHAPWSVLCRLAEELNLRAPLQVIIHHHDHYYGQHHHYNHYSFDHHHYNQSLKNYTSVRRYKCYFELLCSYPQELQIIAPFPQMYPTRPVNWSQSLLSSLCIPNPMVNKVTNQHQDQSDRNIPT